MAFLSSGTCASRASCKSLAAWLAPFLLLESWWLSGGKTYGQGIGFTIHLEYLIYFEMLGVGQEVWKMFVSMLKSRYEKVVEDGESRCSWRNCLECEEASQHKWSRNCRVAIIGLLFRLLAIPIVLPICLSGWIQADGGTNENAEPVEFMDDSLKFSLIQNSRGWILPKPVREIDWWSWCSMLSGLDVEVEFEVAEGLPFLIDFKILSNMVSYQSMVHSFHIIVQAFILICGVSTLHRW